MDNLEKLKEEYLEQIRKKLKECYDKGIKAGEEIGFITCSLKLIENGNSKEEVYELLDLKEELIEKVEKYLVKLVEAREDDLINRSIILIRDYEFTKEEVCDMFELNQKMMGRIEERMAAGQNSGQS